MRNTISTITLRQQLTELIDHARSTNERIVIESQGEPVAALISLEDLHLLEAQEDAHDISAADEAKAEGGSVPLDDLLAAWATEKES